MLDLYKIITVCFFEQLCFMKTYLKQVLKQKGGETGIRTLERLFNTVNRLAGGPNRPLWHLPVYEPVERFINLLSNSDYKIVNGGRGIRTPGEQSPLRFSRPLPSSTRPSLLPSGRSLQGCEV